MQIRSIDIHNHLLPGVDDGFGNAEDSVDAIRLLMEAGVKELVFTPHLNPDVYPDNSEDFLRARYESFLPRIPSGIRTSIAAEYMICPNFDKGLSKRANSMLRYEDNSILVEMSYYFRSPNLESTLFELQMAGLKPILAHPERYLYMAENLEDFDKLHENGFRFQVNYLSFTGVYGADSVRIIRYLLKKGLCDFLSTDLHSLHQGKLILQNKPSFFLRKLFSTELSREDSAL